MLRKITGVTLAATNNKCVGDTNMPAGPTVGDDFVNSDDALCDMWTSRDGLMTIYHFIPTSCVFEVRSAEKGFGGVRFTGGWDSYKDTNGDGTKDAPDPNQALDTDKTSNPTALDDYRAVGYQVTVAKSSNPIDPTVLNTSVIVGSHDPNYPGRQITYNAACPASTPRLEFLNVPYHTMLRTADEVFCGLDITQDPVNGWQDLVNNGTGGPAGRRARHLPERHLRRFRHAGRLPDPARDVGQREGRNRSPGGRLQHGQPRRHPHGGHHLRREARLHAEELQPDPGRCLQGHLDQPAHHHPLALAALLIRRDRKAWRQGRT
jgi:hypothetical protein